MNLYRSAISRAQSLANALTVECGWKKGEAGWNFGPGLLNERQKSGSSAELPALLRIADEQRESGRVTVHSLFEIQLLFCPRTAN